MSLSEAAAAMRRAGDAVEEGAFAVAEAVGIALDNLQDPRCAVVVHRGEVVYESIAPGLAALPGEQVEDVLRATRFMALGSWLAQMRG